MRMLWGFEVAYAVALKPLAFCGRLELQVFCAGPRDLGGEGHGTLFNEA